MWLLLIQTFAESNISSNQQLFDKFLTINLKIFIPFLHNSYINKYHRFKWLEIIDHWIINSKMFKKRELTLFLHVRTLQDRTIAKCQLYAHIVINQHKNVFVSGFMPIRIVPNCRDKERKIQMRLLSSRRPSNSFGRRQRHFLRRNLLALCSDNFILYHSWFKRAQ